MYAICLSQPERIHASTAPRGFGINAAAADTAKVKVLIR
jgi:hypothetical protein